MGAPKGRPKYGGGRPPGGLNRVTLEIKELAREYGPAGIARLAEFAFEDPPGELEAVNILRAMELIRRVFDPCPVRHAAPESPRM
jgi:hypothetical protein